MPQPQQHQILNPLREARDWTPLILMDIGWVCYYRATTGTPGNFFFLIKKFFFVWESSTFKVGWALLVPVHVNAHVEWQDSWVAFELHRDEVWMGHTLQGIFLAISCLNPWQEQVAHGQPCRGWYAFSMLADPAPALPRKLGDAKFLFQVLWLKVIFYAGTSSGGSMYV